MAGDGRSGLSESKRNRAPKAARRSGDQCELSIQTKLIEDSHLLDNFRGFLQTTIAVRRIAMRTDMQHVFFFVQVQLRQDSWPRIAALLSRYVGRVFWISGLRANRIASR